LTAQRDESTRLPNNLTNHQLKRPMQAAAATETDDELAAQREEAPCHGNDATVPGAETTCQLAAPTDQRVARAITENNLARTP
jgi:hypothetical protein